jgi:hypothetical protein
LQVIAGPDQQDTKTLDQPELPDYLSCLHHTFIEGKRIGVLRGPYCDRAAWKEDAEDVVTYRLTRFNEAINVMKRIGACVVDQIEITTAQEIFEDRRVQETLLFRKEFKASPLV